MSRKEYRYHPGEPDRWDDYRKGLQIVGYSWAVRRQAEQQRRRAKFWRYVRRLLWFALLAVALRLGSVEIAAAVRLPEQGDQTGKIALKNGKIWIRNIKA